MIARFRSRFAAASVAFVIMAAGVLIVPSPAHAIHGTADIKPIESNIAAKFWASATASSGSSTAGSAIDGNPATSWYADGPSARQRITVDLGGAYDNLRKVKVLFADRGVAYRYTIEASPDGSRWNEITGRSHNRTGVRGVVHLFTRPGTRFVRLTIISTAKVGVSELQVFNYLRDDLTLGADLSWMDDRRNHQYWVNPLSADKGAGPHVLDVVKDRGMQYSRLRIFNEPRSESTGLPNAIPYQGPQRSLQPARWIKDRKMGLGIDFHYADSWADPSKQPKPRAWAQLEFGDLTKAVYGYTQDYLRQLIRQGTTPDKVAVGNEVQTDLMPGQADSEHAVPLDAYIAEVMSIIEAQPDAREIQVERVKFLRYAEARGDYEQVVAMLNGMAPHGN